jgi:hypothetical protein
MWPDPRSGVDETAFLVDVERDQPGIRGKPIPERPQPVHLGAALGNQVNVKPKDRAFEGDAAFPHRPGVGLSSSAGLRLKAQAIDDGAYLAQLPIGDHQHQVENALAVAPGHGRAADVLDLESGQGGLQQSHDAVCRRRAAAIPRSQVNDFWGSWSIVGANRQRSLHR